MGSFWEACTLINKTLVSLLFVSNAPLFYYRLVIYPDYWWFHFERQAQVLPIFLLKLLRINSFG